jgi:cytoskeletal protein RodZ
MAQTIGQQLKQARQERNLTIDKVVESTRIRAQYIEAMEADEFEILPSPVQARAFLRLYAGFLELSLDDMISRQVAESDNGSADLLQTEPAALQEQTPAPLEVPAALNEDEAVSVAGSPQTIRQKLNDFFSWVKQIVPLSKKTSSSQESTTETAVTVPESLPDPPAGPVDMEMEAAVLQTEAAAPPKDPEASQVIFTTIGESLRQRRETLSLTFDEIERNTHVRTHYLKALECGDFDHLPSSVQARGMLNNYARFLDMDVDGLLLQFAEGLQSLRVERQPKPVDESLKTASKAPFKINLPPALRRYLSMDILVGGGLVMLLLAFAIWGTSRIIGLRSASTPQPTAPSISDMLRSTPEGTAETPSPTNETGGEAPLLLATETLIISIPAKGPGAVSVVVVALESAWVRVVVDQKTQFEGRIIPGTAYSYDGNSQIEVLTGNGAAVDILYNQSDLGPMGALGEVVNHIYTVDAILNPTATFTPSPTISPIPSKTVRPSPTLRPSLTPRRSSTPTQ